MGTEQSRRHQWLACERQCEEHRRQNQFPGFARIERANDFPGSPRSAETDAL